MKDLFTRLEQQINLGEPSMIVAIVAHSGSAPRGAGAMLLLGEQGRLWGTIGGGEVEYRSLEEGAQLLKIGQSRLIDYDLDMNKPGGLSMACGGQVRVLYQYIPGHSTAWSDLAKQALSRLNQHRFGWLLADLARIDKPWELLDEPPKRENTYTWELPIGERVIIFGGGHICQSLVPILAGLDFRPIIFENRPDFAKTELFPGAEQVILADYQDISATLEIKKEDYLIIMTNGHSHDYQVERQVINMPHTYLGIIGSKGKTALINKQLLSEGITQEQLDRVYTPIGLAIGAATPSELAISIAGELIMVRAGQRKKKDSTCPV